MGFCERRFDPGRTVRAVRLRPGEATTMAEHPKVVEARDAFQEALSKPQLATGENIQVRLSSLQSNHLAGFLKSVEAAHEHSNEEYELLVNVCGSKIVIVAIFLTFEMRQAHRTHR